MITTICLNPAFDRTVRVSSLVPGQVNRILAARTDAGGKGINVAIVAQRLGTPARVIGCAGIEGQRKLRQALHAEGVAHAFHTVEGAVRTNTKIVPDDGSGVTELNESGPALSAEDIDLFFDLAIDQTEDSEYVVMAGSLPKGCPSHTYRELIALLRGRKCILDASGDALMTALPARPFLVKPNRQELAAALGGELTTMEDVRRAALALIDKGAQQVLVSLGGEGALYVSPDRTIYAPAVPVEVKSTVGAGDAMVGGLVHGLTAFGTLEDALRCAVAAGTASVMTEGTQLVNQRNYEALLPLVQLQEW